MAFILTASKSCFGVLIFVLFAIILVIWLAALPPQEVIILWYAMIMTIALSIIAWVSYMHQKDLQKEKKTRSSRPETKPSSNDEPKVGHTYHEFEGGDRDDTR